jgi:hypothetical protein
MEVLQLVEEALDQIALPIDRGIDRALDLAVVTGRDVSPTAAACDQIDERASILAPVGNEIAAGFDLLDQDRRDRLVRSLALRQHDAHRHASFVDDSIDLGARSSLSSRNKCNTC